MKKLLVIIMLFVCSDLCPSSAVVEGLKTEVENEDSVENDTELPLTKGTLSYILEKYDVHHQDIVMSQAILETGNFKSDLCIKHGNLFGIKQGNKYAHYKHWTESVIAYRDKVQYKYKEGEDYYTFLKRIKYASDCNYIKKLKNI